MASRPITAALCACRQADARQVAVQQALIGMPRVDGRLYIRAPTQHAEASTAGQPSWRVSTACMLLCSPVNCSRPCAAPPGLTPQAHAAQTASEVRCVTALAAGLGWAYGRGRAGAGLRPAAAATARASHSDPPAAVMATSDHLPDSLLGADLARLGRHR